MLTFVSFAWQQPGYHTDYTAERAASWARMISEHYAGPARFVVVTDATTATFAAGIEAVPLWGEWGEVGNPHGKNYPNCYRRLRLFGHDAADVIGADRFVCMDMDCVATGDLTPLFDRPDDFVIWRDPGHPRQPYNGGLWMLKAGTRQQVWRDFRGGLSASDARAAGYVGSDQAWIAYSLGRGEKVWTTDDGVVSYRRDIVGKSRPVSSTRLVMFHGRPKPWDDGAPEWSRRWY